MNAAIDSAMNVLVVDDSDTVRSRICGLLSESPRIRVVAASRLGEEALEAVARFRPDATVLDFDLRQVSGLKLLRSIKSRLPRCVIVILTSFPAGPFREVSRALGANAIFHKASEFQSVPAYLSSLAPCSQDLSVPIHQP